MKQSTLSKKRERREAKRKAVRLRRARHARQPKPEPKAVPAPVEASVKQVRDDSQRAEVESFAPSSKAKIALPPVASSLGQRIRKGLGM